MELLATLVITGFSLVFGLYLLITGRFTMGSANAPTLNFLVLYRREPVQLSSWSVRFLGAVLVAVSGLVIWQLATGG